MVLPQLNRGRSVSSFFLSASKVNQLKRQIETKLKNVALNNPPVQVIKVYDTA